MVSWLDRGGRWRSKGGGDDGRDRGSGKGGEVMRKSDEPPDVMEEVVNVLDDETCLLCGGVLRGEEGVCRSMASDPGCV